MDIQVNRFLGYFIYRIFWISLSFSIGKTEKRKLFTSSDIVPIFYTLNIAHFRYGARANRMFMRMGGWRARSRLVSLWFDIGALVALGCSMLATALLSLLLYNTIMRKPIKQQVLVPVVCSSKFNYCNYS